MKINPLYQDEIEIIDFTPDNQAPLEEKITHETINALIVQDNSFAWPSPYVMNENGLHIQQVKAGEEGEQIILKRISDAFDVIGVCCNNEDDESGVFIKIRTTSGKEKSFNFPNSEIVSESMEIIKALANFGLNIVDVPKLKKALNNAFAKARANNRLVLLVNQSGWIDEAAFCLKDVIIQSDKKLIHRQDVTKRFTEGGSLIEWQEHIAKYAKGNSRLVIALCAGFAAPLLSMMNKQGFGLHFQGKSSLGKTTAISVANSLYGGGYCNWRTTDNALEATAKNHNNMLLALDDIGESDSKAAGAAAYMLANGKGKARANKNGDSKSVSEWCLIFLSTGEISLSEHMSKGGVKAMAGQEVRFINIPADAGNGNGIFENVHGSSGAILSDKLQKSAKKYFGSPIKEYIEKLVANERDSLIRRLKINIKAHSDFISNGLKLSAQASRVLDHFALLAAAGELSTEYGITGFNKGEAIKAAKTCFIAWLNDFGNDDYEAKQALSAVRMFIQAHELSRFEIERSELDFAQDRIINRVGFIKEERGEKLYCFYPDIFKSEVIKGHNLKVALTSLKEGGFLKFDEGRNQSSIRFKSAKHKVYAIKASFINDEE